MRRVATRHAAGTLFRQIATLEATAVALSRIDGVEVANIALVNSEPFALKVV